MGLRERIVDVGKAARGWGLGGVYIFSDKELVKLGTRGFGVQGFPGIAKEPGISCAGETR